MKYLFRVSILLLLIFSKSFSQVHPGARQIALAHSDVALSNDVFAVFNNPAGTAQLMSREIGFYYSPSPFDLKELANGYAVVSEPTEFGVFSAGFMFYGFELYKENKISLSYSNKLSDNFLFGITGTYHNLKIERYGSDNTFSFNLGGIAVLSESWKIGFYAENISRATYGNESDQIPTVLWLGTSFKPVNQLNTFFALEKDLDYDPSFRFGIEYRIIENLSLRSGFNNYPSTYNFGVGIFLGLFEFDYALFTHQDLGLTHQAGLIIRFDK